MDLKSAYAGVDLGASRTKVAILDSAKNLLGHAVKKSGTDFAASADFCLDASLKMAGLKKDDIEHTIATGYGRNNVAFARDTKTEIGCHAKGSFFYFPFASTIIDIGGQDNKVIKVDQSGKRTGFTPDGKGVVVAKINLAPVFISLLTIASMFFSYCSNGT